MSCVTAIAKTITNCSDTPRAGYEKTAWIVNQKHILYTIGAYGSLLEFIGVKPGKTSYEVETVKKEIDGGFQLIPDEMGDMFAHNFSIKSWERDSEGIVNIDDMNGIVIIAELKGEKTEGCFVAYGIDVGLWHVSSRWKVNDGPPSFDFRTPSHLGERYSKYIIWDTDYDTTKAMILAMLETVPFGLEDDSGDWLTESGDKILWE